MRYRHGFTLIELSIVLVIIGLIVGGVLVGRDMIRAAEIRATVSQVEQLDAAVNTFKTKYGCLVSDCTTTVSLGFTGAGNGLWGVGNGDGNGAIDKVEVFYFNTVLQQASLIGNTTNDSYYGALKIPIKMPSINSTGDQGGWWTEYMVNTSANISINQSGHYYWATTGNELGAVYNNKFVFYAGDAYALDVKMDDGLPAPAKLWQPGQEQLATAAASPRLLHLCLPLMPHRQQEQPTPIA